MIYAVFFPFIAGILIWFLFKNKTSEKDRGNLSNVMTGISVAELAMTLFLMFSMAPDTKEMFAGVGGLGLGFAYSGFRGIFGVLTAFAWFVTFLFAKEYMKADEAAVRYDVFNMFTLGATMGIFYASDLFTVFFFLCDYICILVFCPFQTCIMKNKCCVNCRIYDWGHFMMFTPMLFIPNFYSWSLFFTACVVLIRWEVVYAAHPERFWSGSNQILQCANCKDKTCQVKRRVRKLFVK